MSQETPKDAVAKRLLLPSGAEYYGLLPPKLLLETKACMHEVDNSPKLSGHHEHMLNPYIPAQTILLEHALKKFALIIVFWHILSVHLLYCTLVP